MKGSYSTTHYGIPHVHKSIADFIQRRDGVRSDPEEIIFSSGLEKVVWVRCILEMFAFFSFAYFLGSDG